MVNRAPWIFGKVNPSPCLPLWGIRHICVVGGVTITVIGTISSQHIYMLISMPLLSNKPKCGKQSKIRNVGVRRWKSMCSHVFWSLLKCSLSGAVCQALCSRAHPSGTDLRVCMFAYVWVSVCGTEFEQMLNAWVLFIYLFIHESCGLVWCQQDSPPAVRQAGVSHLLFLFSPMNLHK